jgi:hypothetical protein
MLGFNLIPSYMNEETVAGAGENNDMMLAYPLFFTTDLHRCAVCYRYRSSLLPSDEGALWAYREKPTLKRHR